IDSDSTWSTKIIEDVDFKQGHVVDVGDITGDGSNEIVIADTEPRLRVLNWDGHLWAVQLDFEKGDKMAVGDVTGDDVAEIIIGDKSQNSIKIFDDTNTKIGEFEVYFEDGDDIKVGDVNLDGIAEIIHASSNANMISIYDMAGTELGIFSLDNFRKGDGFAVGDVTMNGVDEIVHADYKEDMISLYDMNGDLIKKFGRDFRQGDGLAIGDVDGGSVIVGEPIHSQQTIADQVIAIINAPPKHLGVINDSGVFYASHENEIGEQTSHSLKTTTDFAFSAKISISYGFSKFAEAKAELSAKSSSKFERETGGSFTQTIGHGLTADIKDRVIHTTTHYDVYEFPIINPPNMAVVDGEQQYIMAVVPIAPPSITLDDYNSPIHTVGDIRTYPGTMGELLGYKSKNLINYIEFVISADKSSAWLELTESEYQAGKHTSSFEFSAGATISAGAPGFAKGSFNVQADYGSEKLRTNKISITEENSIKVNYQGGITDEDQKYTVRSVMYYDDETGALILDYIIPVMGSHYDHSALQFGSFSMGDSYYGGIFGGFNFSGYTTEGTILSVDTTQSTPGSEVQLPIKISDAENIGNMDITLTYDDSILSALTLTTGAITADSLFMHNIEPGIINISLVDSEGIDGEGSIAIITFEVIGNEGDISPLILSALANDRDAAAINMEIMNAFFSVEDEESLKGDVNGDGKITSADALLALQMAVGLIEEDLVADMNDDGKVTSLDAAMILDIATGNAVIDTGYKLRGFNKGIKPRQLPGNL
ncbi:MAG: cohesin domain-containing protein, partial [Candidatus Thermoplasmatota archaeon]|nr:cohesin domain-containing protein [Candidatus Thermoplasmatota archaeon]